MALLPKAAISTTAGAVPVFGSTPSTPWESSSAPAVLQQLGSRTLVCWHSNPGPLCRATVKILDRRRRQSLTVQDGILVTSARGAHATHHLLSQLRTKTFPSALTPQALAQEFYSTLTTNDQRRYSRRCCRASRARPPSSPPRTR